MTGDRKIRQIRTCGASVAQRCSYSKESFVTFPSISHVALTVTDLEASAAWYERLLCACPVLNEDAGPFWHTVYPLAGGTLLGLHRHPGTRGNDRFDPLRPGLDHVAFASADRDELQTWQACLDELGIRHGGIFDARYGSALSFKDPDGNALEFFAPPTDISRGGSG